VQDLLLNVLTVVFMCVTFWLLPFSRVFMFSITIIAINFCRRFGCHRYDLSPFWFVAILTIERCAWLHSTVRVLLFTEAERAFSLQDYFAPGFVRISVT